MNNTTHDNYPEYPEGGKRASGGRRRKKKKQSRALYYVILLILLGVLVFSAVKIISYFKQQSDAADAQQEISDNYITPGNSTDDNTDDTQKDNDKDKTTKILPLLLVLPLLSWVR